MDTKDKVREGGGRGRGRESINLNNNYYNYINRTILNNVIQAKVDKELINKSKIQSGEDIILVSNNNHYYYYYIFRILLRFM